MKKIIAIFAILVCSLFCINVKAELINLPEEYEHNQSMTSKFRTSLNSMYFWNRVLDWEYGNLYFNDQEEINVNLIIEYIGFDYRDYFEDYIISGDKEVDSDGNSWYLDALYQVPADVFESIVQKTFRINNKTLNEIRDQFRTCDYIDMLHELDYKEIDGKYYYTFQPLTGWGGADEGEYKIWLGYKYLGNNQYEVYQQLLSLYAEAPEAGETYIGDYVPSESDILGEDYILANIETWNEETEKYVLKTYPVRITGYIKAKVSYDGEFVKYLSFEKISAEQMPDLSELSKEDKMPAISTKTDDVKINANEGIFPENTKITVEKQEKGNIFDIASKALKEKFASFVIYEINAKAGEYDVEPNGKVEISIKVPEGYKSPVIYYVSEDGKLEKLETKVKDGYAVAEVTHFSTYALVDEKVTIVEKVEQVVDKVVENVVDNPKTGIISGVGIVAVAGGCGAYFYTKNKKKNKFPQS